MKTVAERERKKGTRKRYEHFRRSLRERENGRGKRTQEARNRRREKIRKEPKSSLQKGRARQFACKREWNLSRTEHLKRQAETTPVSSVRQSMDLARDRLLLCRGASGSAQAHSHNVLDGCLEDIVLGSVACLLVGCLLNKGATESSSRQAITPARYDEGTLATNHNAATGERGYHNTRLELLTCRHRVERSTAESKHPRIRKKSPWG